MPSSGTAKEMLWRSCQKSPDITVSSHSIQCWSDFIGSHFHYHLTSLANPPLL
ncbi:rCG25884 [Rattus norvegicus]|uniref:RCG25884 n=1 Tax=Rattus norvegicus TaxID=10116 RepID=A6I2K8_RAT|nr:rCG25884 [Rattus norvegicus]